jgi:hypothetical protein
LLAACLVIAALLLAPIAMRQSGSAGPLGLAIAAGSCLAAGFLSELIGARLARSTPLGATLVGMMVRMALPLALCIGLVAMGQNGRQHLAFIGYLLTFYVLTLALETCFAVKRASGRPKLKQTSP